MEDQKVVNTEEQAENLTGRREFLKTTVTAAAAGVVVGSGLMQEAEAQEAMTAQAQLGGITEAKRRAVFGRTTRFCVVPHDSLAMVNNRTNDEVIKAQGLVTDDLLNSMEAFIKAARAGKLEGQAVLGLACAEW